MLYDIKPVPKPRMTRADKWKKRACVLRYWAFKDEIKLKRVKLAQEGSLIIFTLPMPESWGDKKKLSMDKKPHKQKPDLDNLIKALFDALYQNDAGIHDFKCLKIWGYKGSIEIL